MMPFEKMSRPKIPLVNYHTFLAGSVHKLLLQELAVQLVC